MPDFVPHALPVDFRQALPSLVQFYLGDSYIISELMAGEELTVFVRDGVVGVGDWLGVVPAGGDTLAAKWIYECGMAEMLAQFEEHLQKPFVLQGYLIGPDYKSNPYDLVGNQFVVSGILDLEKRVFLTPAEMQWFVKVYNESTTVTEKLVMVHSTVYETPFAPAARAIAVAGGEAEVIARVTQDVQDDLLTLAGGISSMFPTKERAGLVFRSTGTSFVFKVEKEVT